MNKTELRKQAKEKKKYIDFSCVSEEICKKIMAMDEFLNASCVLLYSALPDEVCLDKLIENLSKRNVCCALPTVVGDDIVVRKFDGNTTIGEFGITEATGDFVQPGDIDFAVIPGVMFDLNKRRLGRGKGFYDRFLPGLACTTVGICPDVLLVDDVPGDKHDIPVNVVVTDKRVIL